MVGSPSGFSKQGPGERINGVPCRFWTTVGKIKSQNLQFLVETILVYRKTEFCEKVSPQNGWALGPGAHGGAMGPHEGRHGAAWTPLGALLFSPLFAVGKPLKARSTSYPNAGEEDRSKGAQVG